MALTSHKMTGSVSDWACQTLSGQVQFPEAVLKVGMPAGRVRAMSKSHSRSSRGLIVCLGEFSQRLVSDSYSR